MITINLKPGSKRAKAGSPLAGGLSQLKALPGKVKDPWPMAAIAAWVLVLGFLGYVGVSASLRAGRLEPQIEAARSENRRYRQFLAQKRRAEAVKDSIVAQIATIRSVDADRYVWPHILDEVTRALPPFTWLTDVQAVTASGGVEADSTAPAPRAGVQVVGRTMDLQGLTRFMRQLEDSPFLADITVLSTETVVDRGRAVTSFILKAAYADPPREFVRTTSLLPEGGR